MSGLNSPIRARSRFPWNPASSDAALADGCFEGSSCMPHALDYTRLLVTTHPNNEAMKRLARTFEARLSFADGSTMGEIELHRADLDGVGEMRLSA